LIYQPAGLHTMPRTDRTERASRSATRDSPYALRAANPTVTASPYTPIDSENGEIRLLELAPGKFEDDIELRLVSANLNDDPSAQYEALSYVWGTEVSSRKALLDGIPVAITQNLDCAIRHLRMKVVTRILWIDALSINQTDTQERGQQVQFMKDIYATAHDVIIWLGPVKQSDLYLRAVLGVMQFHLSNDNSTAIGLFDFMCSVVGLMEEQSPDPQDPKDCVIEALRRIIERSWFRRIWVVQELAVSRSATIRIGSYAFPWQTFEFFFKWLPCHNVDPVLYPGLVNVARRVARITCGDHFDVQFHRTLHLSATDPRDKIYSILGISNFQGSPITPEYSLPISKVFSMAAASLLREDRLTLYFSLALQPARVRSLLSNMPNLPSWVPDLRIPSEFRRETNGEEIQRSYHNPMGIISTDSLSVTFPTMSLQKTLIAICERLPLPVARFSDDLNTLYAPGVLIGTITDVPKGPIHALGTDCSRSVREFYCSCLKHAGVKAEHFIDTLYNRHINPNDSSEMHGQLLLQGMLDPKRKLDIAASSRNNFRNYYCALCRRTMNQTLFVTNKAHFGVSYHPDDAQGIRIGDEVVGLFGINFPFILRRNADQTHRMVNVARISGHTLGHAFLGNNVKPKPEPSVDSRSLGSHSRTHAAGASWKDYEQFGMREYAIV
jgi:hypothetical protein